MKTRKEGSKARLLGLSCMALVLTAFGVTGVRADAADAKKAPPLVNLAEEKDVKVTVGENMDLKNADLLTTVTNIICGMMLQVIKRETTGRIIRNREQKSPALQKEKTVCGYRWIWAHPIRWKSSI